MQVEHTLNIKALQADLSIEKNQAIANLENLGKVKGEYQSKITMLTTELNNEIKYSTKLKNMLYETSSLFSKLSQYKITRSPR
jgi:phage host-nuclease inhibitor protein Gam